MSGSVPPDAPKSLARIASDITDIADPSERRNFRAALIEQALSCRREARRLQTGARLADTLAKFGGGSLLTATLLLIIGGQAAPSILITTSLALILLVAGTISWTYCDLKSARRDLDAERLEAALKEAER